MTFPASPAARPEPLLTSVLFVLGRWRTVLRWAVVGAVIAATFAVLRPERYAAYAAFVPARRSGGPSNLSALAGNLGLSGLQQDTEGPQFFADLLKTPELLLPIVRERIPVGGADVRGRTLVDLYGGTGGDAAVREERALEAIVRHGISTSVVAKTGVVRLAALTRWAPVSRWLAEGLLERLNDFNVGNRRVQASDERRFAEGLLRARRDSLRRAEEQLEEFVLRNRDYSNSPTLALTADRLRREASLQLGLLQSTASMYEDARLREVRDTRAIVTVETPRLPIRPLPKGVAALGILGGLAGAVVAALGLLFARAAIAQRALGDPEAAALLAGVSRLRPGRRRPAEPAVTDVPPSDLTLPAAAGGRPA